MSINKHRNSYLLSLFALVLVVCPIYSQGVERNSIEDLLVLTGDVEYIKDSINQVEKGLRNERLTNPSEALNDDELKKFMENVEYSLIFKSITTELSEKLSSEDIDYLKKHFTSNVKKKEVKSLIESLTIDSSVEQAKYFVDIQTNPPEKERVMLLHQLESDYMAAEMSVFTRVSIERGKQEEILSHRGLLDSTAKQKMQYYLSEMSEKMEAPARNQIRMYYMYFYKDFSNEELMELIELANDKIFVKFTTNFEDAYVRSIVASIRKGFSDILKLRDKAKA